MNSMSASQFKIWSSIVLFSVLILVNLPAYAEMLPSTSVQTTNQDSIPHWVKAVAGWWAEGKISDADFQQAVQFLADTGVIKVHNATGIITSLQLEASQVNSTRTTLDASNQTVLSSSTFESLSHYSSLWNDGKISDTEYFKVLQNVINIGGFGPFVGPQNKTEIPTYQEIIENVNPKTVMVMIPTEQENETVTIFMGDSVKFVSADHSQEWTIIGNLRGVGDSAHSSNTEFNAYLISDERHQTLSEVKATDPYSANMTIPDYTSTVKFVGNTGTWDCSYYYVNDHIGKDFKINVTVQFRTVTGIQPWLKENMLIFAESHDQLNSTVEEFYKMGLVHNP